MKKFKRIISIFLLALIILFSPSSLYADESKAIFAGGCFWCVEHDFENIQGILSVDSGYIGGEILEPTYENHKGHQEAVLITFEDESITYNQLLRNYWRNIDPLDNDGQFCDRGNSYIPVIFTLDKDQEKLARKSINSAARELRKPLNSLKVDIREAGIFWPAEEYHQDFARRNNLKYNFYRYSCGRDFRLDAIWGDKARSLAKWGT